MKKILTVVLMSVITLIISSGCNGATQDVAKKAEIRDAKITEDALHVDTRDNEKILKMLKKAAAKTGWKITEFKINEVIAEKTEGENTVSSSVVFGGGYVEFKNQEDTSDLRDALEDALETEDSSH